MTPQELHNLHTFQESQKQVCAQFENNKLHIDNLKLQASRFLKQQGIEEAIFELEGRFYRFWIDPDDELQISLIAKVFS